MAQPMMYGVFPLILSACAVDKGVSDGATVQDTGLSLEVDDSGLTDTSEPIDSSGQPNDSEEGNEPESEGDMSLFTFRSTHNSYSGGARLDILSQLDLGVRGLEFDLHDNDYQLIGDYQIGHYHPGGEVDQSAFNPSSDRLSDWLDHISDWSLLHPNHAPVTLVLDLKDNLTDNPNFDSGNMAALNDKLLAAFGERLHVANGAPLPDMSQLRGKLICVISGDAQSRAMYKRDKGENPSIAINDSGQVLSVHDSGAGELWYWSGQLSPDGTVHWLRHGRYGTGIDPAVALNNAGHFVTVHQSENHETLWAHTGQISTSGEPFFSSSSEYDSGVSPTIQFVSKDSSVLVERHLSENSDLVWEWMIELNPSDLQATFSGNHQSQSELFASDQDGNIEIFTQGHFWAGSDTLLYRVAELEPIRVRYPQLCYVEVQSGDSPELSHYETHFFAASAGALNSLEPWREMGLIRGWEFGSSHVQNGFPYHYPAADEPFSPWMEQWCILNNCIE